MNCSRFETMLTDYLDGRLEPPVRQAMDQHLDSCPKCVLLLSEVDSLRSELREFPVITPTEELITGILEKTSGISQRRALWSDIILPLLQPFLSQRFAFATVMMFVFISFAVNLIGPEFSASSYSSLRPSALVARADRFSAQVYKKWLEFNDLKARVGEEIRHFKEDLFGRLDYHLVSIWFRSYSESLESEQEEQQAEEKGANDTNE